MSLRNRIWLARGVLYACGLTALLALSAVYWFCIIFAIAWVFQRPQLIRYVFLPLLVRNVRCTNGECRNAISLTQRWQIGEQYKHRRAAHVLTIHNDRQQEIGKFDCPKCKTTIQVQKGTGVPLTRGTIIDNDSSLVTQRRFVWLALIREFVCSFRKTRHPAPFPIGYDRNVRYGRKERMVRKLLHLPTRKMIKADENDYGQHICIFGKSGKGKSTLIQTQLKWMLENDLGGTVIDPAGDLIDDALKLIPAKRKNDVVLIRVSDEQHPARLNLLETNSRIDDMNLRYEMLSALKAVSRGWGDDIAYHIDKAIQAAKKVDGSMIDVYELFTTPSTRHDIIARLTDEALIEFWEQFDRKPPRCKASVIRKLESVVKHPLLEPMLDADSCDFNADENIRKSKIVLIDLDSGSTSDDLKIILGTFLIGKTRAAAMRQDREKRVRHFLIIDEAVDFMHEGMNFPKMFSQARKHLLTLVLAAQYITQMPDKIRLSAFGNSSMFVAFNVDLDDAKIIAARLDGVTANDIQTQRKFECIVGIDGKPFFAKTIRPTPEENNQTDYIVERNRAKRRALATSEEIQPKRNRAQSIVTNVNALAFDGAEVCDRVR